MAMKLAVAAVALGTLAAVNGCGMGTVTGTQSTTVVSAKRVVNGKVHGGQQPISGAVIQLYAVGIAGLKSAATPLVAMTVTTAADGSFSITGDWDCTSNTATYGVNPLLYITATGGNPGMPGPVNNSSVVMMAALGACSGVNASTFISLDEMTTVAAAYALAPFMSDALHVGAVGVNPVGLVNAFATAALLVDTTTGMAPGRALPSNATAPVSELNTLADALAPCVNSDGVDGTCASLFAVATATAGGPQPTDIMVAALNIVANPTGNGDPEALLQLVTPKPPFQPTLSIAPNDWTVALNFTGGGLKAPAALALDASGDVWVANAGGNSVTELSSTGTLLTGASGYAGSNNLYGAQGIAVDRVGNVWVADTLLSSVVELTVSGGVVQSNASYTNGGISGPIGLAIDSQNDVWVSNFAGASVTELSSNGTAIGSGALTAGGTLQAPMGIAIDAAGNVWVSDNAAWDVVEFSNNQVLRSAGGYTDGAMTAPEGLALDESGRVWIADNGNNATSLFGTTGSSLVATPFSGGGLAMPAAVAVDGAGTVWVANSQTAGSVSELLYGESAPISPPSGLAVLNAPSAIVVDASGNVWTANSGDDSVSEIVGLGTPAMMPLAAHAGP
jgi:sugar lactone lactonase YvrE